MKVYAHRGCTRGYPENTRPALLAALTSGVDGIEFDVRLSRDGVPMVIHDDRIDRTSDGVGAVAEMSLDELRAVDAGAWFDPRFAGERFVTLDEALCLDAGLDLNIHLKPCAAWRDLVARCVEALQSHGRHDTAYLTGDADMVSHARALQAHVRTCCLVPHPRNTPEAIDRALGLGCSNMQVGHQMIEAAFVELAHSCGLPIHAMYLGASAQDVSEMRRLADCGVAALMLDHAELWLARP